MHGWLNADVNNIAVVHCLSGTGRTVSTVATYLSWAGLVSTPQRAVRHIAKILKKKEVDLLILSQRRSSLIRVYALLCSEGMVFC